MSMDVTPDSSAILANLTQITQVGDASAQTVSKSTISSTGKQAQKPVDFFPNGVSKRPPPPPPSTRSDLPANVTVTSVDVEAEDFVPGVHTPNFLAPPQVPYFSQGKTPIESSSKSDTTAAAGSKSTLDASAYFNAYSGYYGAVPSKGKGKQKKQAGSSKGANGETVPVNVERYAASLDENHWSGWPTLEDIEGGLFDTYASVTAPGDGEKVAVKVSYKLFAIQVFELITADSVQILELSPTSFLPALSLYFGLVLSLTSSPHSSAIRLKLHPSCRPNAGLEEHDLNTDGVEGGETEPHYPRYFGEDLESPLEDADHPDIKEIKLDDIVDCRRVVLA